MQSQHKTTNFYRRLSATVAVLAFTWGFFLTSPCYAGGNNSFTGGFVGGIVGGIVGGAIQQQQNYQQQYYQQQYYQQQLQQQWRQQQYYQQQLQQQQYYQQQQDAAREEQRERAAAKKKAQKQQNEADQAKLTPPTSRTGSGPVAVAMKRKNGTLWVPAQINKAVAIDFVVDSGAADVTIPVDVFLTLMRTGSISEKDKVGEGKFSTADGSVVEGIRFKLASLQVGDQVLTDVVASVIPKSSVRSDPLLGQSFLSRFQSWSIDNGAGTLNLIPQGTVPTTPAQTQVADNKSQAPPVQQASASSVTTVPTTPAPGQQKPPEEPRTAPSNAVESRETASAPAVPAKDASVALPSFPSNTAYVDARRSLMALGYEPAPLPDAEKCDRNTDKTCFPEREACSAESDTRCAYFWKRGERLIKITTTAMPPTVSSVGCQVNCQ
jgi:clan AA aspartic protease (TIGR02281 family)